MIIETSFMTLQHISLNAAKMYGNFEKFGLQKPMGYGTASKGQNLAIFKGTVRRSATIHKPASTTTGTVLETST